MDIRCDLWMCFWHSLGMVTGSCWEQCIGMASRRHVWMDVHVLYHVRHSNLSTLTQIPEMGSFHRTFHGSLLFRGFCFCYMLESVWQ